jgi:hypothetical protein
MAVNSKIGRALDLLAVLAADGIFWDTDPVAKWYPDFEIELLKTLGLTGFVLPETSDYSPESREQRATHKTSVFFAVMAPIVSGSFDEGDVVIAKAESLQAKFYKKQFLDGSFSIACTDARFEPVMSADYAKQYNTWCAILKMELIVL